MPGATSYAQTSFLGGEVSQSYQGRFDRPDYRTSLNVCLNSIPVETGALLRRPGTAHCAGTRNGQLAKLVTFDFKQPFPYIMEFTDSRIRFFSERQRVFSNDSKAIVAISADDPAIVTTLTAHGWISGEHVVLDVNIGTLQQLELTITVLTPTAFSIRDTWSGVTINGATLAPLTVGTAWRILEVTTPYTGTTWENVRSVQAEETAVLLNGTVPQILTVDQEPTDTHYASFALAAANFLDGPYLDPIDGSWVTPSAVNGVVTLTFSFQSYVATTAYNIGDYVTDGGVGYRSLTANNQGNTPAISGSNWVAVNAGSAVNDGTGFTTADIGRHIRLFAAPAPWNAGTTYATGNQVSYPDSTGADAYWKVTVATTTATPGTSTDWAILTGSAITWTWGRIVSISGTGVIAPATAIGSMSSGGGLAAAFDGTTSKGYAASADLSSSTVTYPVWSYPLFYGVGAVVQYNGATYRKVSTSGDITEFLPPPATGLWVAVGAVYAISIDGYVGQQYGVAKAIYAATIFPTSDMGFTNSGTVTLNLRASNTAPASASDGTLLGTTGNIANTLSAVSIVSNDSTTTYVYVWLEIIGQYDQPLPDDGTHSFTGKLGVAQLVLYTPNVNNGSVVTMQIAGPALPNTNTIRKWRLGLYGGTNGYPTCGAYHEGRLWLSGVIGNRVDASKSGVLKNGVLTLDFAPTAPSGVVADDNAISAIFTAKDVNTIFWMEPDQQGLLCGTQAGEWLISIAAPGAFSPTNIAAHRVTKIGCANIEPCRTDHTLLFVQRYKRKLMEFFAEVFSGKFSAPDISHKAKHLTVSGIEQIAYQQELTPIAWQRLGNGGWRGVTYKRDKLTTAQEADIIGAHQHTHGAGRLIRSIAVGSSAAGNLDSLYMVTEEATGGSCHVEVLTNLLDEGFSVADVWMLDDGVVPSSFAIDATATADAPYGGVTLYGLKIHAGKTVQAYLAGIDCGQTTGAKGAPTISDFTVGTDGTIFIPFGDGVSGGTGLGLFTEDLVQPYALTGVRMPMVVGFTYNSDGQIVRPARPEEAGLPQPSLGATRRSHMFAALLYGAITKSIQFGTDFTTRTLRAARFETKGDEKYTKLQPFSGVHQGTLEADSDFDNMLCWRQSRPDGTAFVIAVEPSLHTQGR